MPTPHAKRLLSAASACGLATLLGLAIGCTPAPAPGAGPDQRALVPSPTASTSPGTSQHPMSVSYSTQVVPLLKSSCAACHGATASGGVSLFDGSGTANYTDIKGRIRQIIAEVSSGGMPKGGTRFTADQVNTLEMWRKEGAPQN